MSEFNPVEPSAPTVEQGVSALLHDAKDSIRNRYEKCEQCVTESPTKAILAAVAAGYVLHRLPLRAILIAKVRILSALTGPALLAFGAAKACEYLQKEARKRSA